MPGHTAAVGRTPTGSRSGTQQAAEIRGLAVQLGLWHRVSGDDRMQQVEYLGGHLWGALGTAKQPYCAAKQRAAIAWLDLSAPGSLSHVSIARQGYLGLKGHDLTYPALQADAAGNAATRTRKAGF